MKNLLLSGPINDDDGSFYWLLGDKELEEMERGIQIKFLDRISRDEKQFKEYLNTTV